MHKKLTQNPEYAKKMVRVRSKTVEPVIGTLVNFTNRKRVNTRGIKNANKHLLMASLSYNLKKYLRFIVKKPTIHVPKMQLQQGKATTLLKTYFQELERGFFGYYNFTIFNFN